MPITEVSWDEQVILAALYHYVYEKKLNLYSIDGKVLFDMRSASGGITTEKVACIITPCTDLHEGQMRHFIRFPGDLKQAPLISDLFPIIDKADRKSVV
jgi:hypothetical protein